MGIVMNDIDSIIASYCEVSHARSWLTYCTC
jgi:hypothetical protein